MAWSPVALPSEPLYESPEVEDLEAALRPAWVDVDLSALEHNLAAIRKKLISGGGRAKAMAVVKADGYGHGAVGVAVIMGRRLRIMLRLTIADGRIVAIDAIADPAQLRELEWTVLNA